MTTIQNYDRIASFMARNILVQEGYTVEKTNGKNSIFHLIAWKEEKDLRFIRIRRSRRPGILQFEEDIFLLTDLVKRNKIPGIAEFWLLSYGKWKKYHILKGGAVPRELFIGP